jgi:ribosome biogenesis GTPase A
VDSKDRELRLAVTGAIRDEVMDVELLAEYIRFRLGEYPGPVAWELYGLAACPPTQDELLDAIGRSRGFRQQGGGFDRNACAVAFLNDYRAGKLGRFTLDLPRQGDGRSGTPSEGMRSTVPARVRTTQFRVWPPARHAGGSDT